MTFLHIYHHAGMVIMMWIVTKYLAGGHGTFLGNENNDSKKENRSSSDQSSIDSNSIFRFGQFVHPRNYVHSLSVDVVEAW